MKLGTYRNTAGAVLKITKVWMGTHGIRTLGSIYVAEAPDPLFGPEVYLVTRESMDEAGYSLVEKNGENA